MKTHLLFIFSFLLFPLIAHAQQGNTRSYPIEVGTYNSEFDYSNRDNHITLTLYGINGKTLIARGINGKQTNVDINNEVNVFISCK